MTASTCKKLLRLGYDEDFIISIIHFRKDNSKRFEMRVSDVDKNYICSACFNTKEELKNIIELLDGFRYNLIDHEKVKRLGTGIINHDCLYMFERKWLNESE